MYGVRFASRLTGATAVLLFAHLSSAHAQAPPAQSPGHEHEAAQPATSVTHDMSTMAREGSGTSWLPDASPMYMVHRQKGPWMLMAHENVFLQFLHESGNRGAHQGGSINWVMGMAERSAGRGHLAVRSMISVEPWTIRGCGYPDLLASGEQCGGEAIHDRQHQHDLAMELSAEYDGPIRGGTRWKVFGGPAAEPALGPVAYPHRISAMPNPIAPIAHHWFDSTHVSFGVVTAGVYGTRWKVESSAFNGREPDERRKNIDFGALDSMAGRVWFLPTPRLAMQVSAGHLREAEPGDGVEPRRDVNKTTATATYHRLGERLVWASTAGWGVNSEGGHATHALLAETSVTRDDRDSWFGRFEVVGKTAHDLDIAPPVAACTNCVDVETFTVSKIQGGYTHYLDSRAFKAGAGLVVSAGFVPGRLRAAYGGTVNTGFGVFLTIRPAMVSVQTEAGHAAGAAGGGRTMVMVQTAFDPAKLTCPAGFDPGTAPSTIYEGKTYYFCSGADRDTFLTDPKMSLSMMPPRQ